jgi:hypothetical protein
MNTKLAIVLIWSCIDYIRFQYDMRIKLECSGQYLAPRGFKIYNHTFGAIIDAKLICITEPKHLLTIVSPEHLTFSMENVELMVMQSK